MITVSICKLSKSLITTYLKQIHHFPSFGPAPIPPSLFLQCLCTRTGTRAENPQPQCVMLCESIGITKIIPTISINFPHHQTSNVKHPWSIGRSIFVHPFYKDSAMSRAWRLWAVPWRCIQPGFSIVTLVCATLYILVIRAYIQARYLDISK